MYAATRLFNLRTLAAFALLFLIMAAAYGFAAANTVGDSFAGDGVGTISGYDVTSVTYTLQATDPRMLSSVAFKLDNAAGTAKIAFPANELITTAPAVWYGCTIANDVDVSCNIPANAVRVFDITFLRVVAVN
ncbi:MAG: hypothetical protein AB4911_13610 [Oscillochloridaceae bacterium umkhey_bin13]